MKRCFCRIAVCSAFIIIVLFLRFGFSKPNTEIKILKGTEAETTISVFSSRNEGPTLFIIGGIHGDEIAGWKAAEHLKKSVKLKCGSLYILSRANVIGVGKDSRYVEPYRDLNRAFPGENGGSLTDLLASEIFAQIESAEPVLLLDLHEARQSLPNQDFLGNSLIVTSADNIEDLLSSVIFATQDGSLCSQPFDIFGSAPSGSINRTASELLSIPTITIETFRDDPLNKRIQNHLDIIHFTLRYFKMES